jgi:hypothetical protein
MYKVSGSRGFYEMLGEKDAGLASTYDELRRRGERNWVHLLGVHLGSHAGLPHLRNVSRIADKIIPDSAKETFGAGEIFLLLSAIFLHDIGKTVDSANDDSRVWNWTHCGYERGDCVINADAPPCLEHNAVGMRIVTKKGTELGLPDERAAQYCALLALCHALEEPPDGDWPPPTAAGNRCRKPVYTGGGYRITSLAPYGLIRVPLLASILRLADEADASWTRSLTEYWYDMLQGRTAALHKAFRRHVEDVEFCHEGKCLIIHVSELDELPERHVKAITDSRAKLNRIIQNPKWSRPLKEIGVEFNDVYIEYRDHLYGSTFRPDAEPEEQPKLGEVVGTHRGSVKALLKAIVRLTLGACGHHEFSWQALEGQLGRQLGDVERWLVRRIGRESPDILSVFITSNDRLMISINDAALAPGPDSAGGDREDDLLDLLNQSVLGQSNGG